MKLPLSQVSICSKELRGTQSISIGLTGFGWNRPLVFNVEIWVDDHDRQFFAITIKWAIANYQCLLLGAAVIPIDPCVEGVRLLRYFTDDFYLAIGFGNIAPVVIIEEINNVLDFGWVAIDRPIEQGSAKQALSVCGAVGGILIKPYGKFCLICCQHNFSCVWLLKLHWSLKSQRPKKASPVSRCSLQVWVTHLFPNQQLVTSDKQLLFTCHSLVTHRNSQIFIPQQIKHTKNHG